MFYLPLSSMCKTPKISSRKKGPPPPCFDRIRTFSSWLFLKSEKNQNILYVLCLFSGSTGIGKDLSTLRSRESRPVAIHQSQRDYARLIRFSPCKTEEKRGSVMPVRLDRISWTRLTFPILSSSPRSSFSLTRHDH